MPEDHVPPGYAPALRAADSVSAVGEIVRTAARAACDADGATFVLRERDLCFYADEDAVAPLWKGQRFPMTECISGWAMRHRESVSVPDIEQDRRVPLAAYRPTFVRSLLMVPIGRARPVGAIGAYWARENAAPQGALRALERLAEHAAAAIARIGLADAPWAPNFAVPGAARPPA